MAEAEQFIRQAASRPGHYQLEDAIQSVHAARAVTVSTKPSCASPWAPALATRSP